MGCGAEIEADALYDYLTSDIGITIPVIDFNDPIFQVPGDENSAWYQPLTRITNADLTSGVVGGTGTFDVLMKGVGAHLKEEFEKGRITGAEYTKAYIALTQTAMTTATEFLLRKEDAYWKALQAQATLITARVQLEGEKVKAGLLQIQALTAQGEFALSKMKLSNESMTYCIHQFNLTNTMPAQLLMLEAQKEGVNRDNLIKVFQLDEMLPAQLLLTTEQTNASRAQTYSNRMDGQEVTGVMGAQVRLYDQQITSYKRDAETKATKLYSDAFITMKTLDEGLAPPDQFTQVNINEVLTTLRNNNDL